MENFLLKDTVRRQRKVFEDDSANGGRRPVNAGFRPAEREGDEGRKSGVKRIGESERRLGLGIGRRLRYPSEPGNWENFRRVK
jgi:hypothetical protein